MEILMQNIVTELGLECLPEDRQIEILDKIGLLIFQSVVLRCLDVMSERDTDEFEKVLGNIADDSQVVLEFMQQKVPNLNEIVRDEVLKFKTEVFGLMSQIE